MSKNPGSLATINDVAALAGVSISTVSRVVNGSAPVAEATSNKVRKAITELNYYPRSAARGLASNKTRTIGLVLPEISGSYFSPLLRGIEDGIRGTGYDLLVHSAVFHQTEKIYPSVRLGEHNTDGLIVFPQSMDLSELQRLQAKNFPVVMLHQATSCGFNFPLVSVENKSGAKKLIDHLIEVHSKRRIVYLSGPSGHDDSTWRECGYRQSLEDHHIKVDLRLIAYGGFSGEQAYSTMLNLLPDVQIDAVFAGDDDAAIGVYRAVNTLGYTIPDDIAVVGFDDTFYSRYVTPSLTTIRVPIEQVGQTAIRLLLNRINDISCEPTILLPTELIIRESCGCKRSGA